MSITSKNDNNIYILNWIHTCTYMMFNTYNNKNLNHQKKKKEYQISDHLTSKEKK